MSEGPSGGARGAAVGVTAATKIVAKPDGAGASATIADTAEPRELAAAGSSIGRYVVIEQVGRGGMGVVLRAYDPRLHREVALKLLVTRSDDGTEQAEREARAMARLAHPNVVAVHDVESDGERLFIVMEYVPGASLRAWLDTSPPWRAVLDAFAAAGAGLAAAHRAGLVHRDVKPENILRGEDGRVRITDFGLAHGDAQTDASRTIAGTPAYMAPEQHEGSSGDARSDQFAFAVALYEGLWRRRPFEGRNLAELGAAKRRGPALPPASDVPQWLVAPVLRALSSEPEQRFADLDGLLAALADDPRPRRRRLALGVGLVAALAAVPLGGRWRAAQIEQGCRDEAAQLDDTWGVVQRTELVRVLGSASPSYASDTAERTAAQLDAWSATWKDAREASCLAEHDGTRVGEPAKIVASCLDAHARELAAAVTVLLAGDESVLPHAVAVAGGLPEVSACTDVRSALAGAAPPSEAQAADVVALRGRLADARAEERAGRYARGAAIADEVLAAARVLEHPPLVAEAAAELGGLLDQGGDFERAEAMLVLAYRTAGAHRHDTVAVDAATSLAYLLGHRVHRDDEGMRWIADAEMMLARTELQGSELAARLADTRGTLETTRGRYDEAAIHHRRAIELWEAVAGPDSAQVAIPVLNLGNTEMERGDYEAALAHYARARAIQEQVYGPEHPLLAYVTSSIAHTELMLGDRRAALLGYERALELREHALGPDHPDVARSLTTLGNLYYLEERFDDAAALHARAIAIVAGGRDETVLAMATTNLANAELARGRVREAQLGYERSIELAERTLGRDHPDLAVPLANLGAVRSELGDVEGAGQALERALELRERALGADHPLVGESLLALAPVDAQRGHVELALERARRAVDIAERKLPVGHPDRVYGNAALADVLLTAGRDDEAVAAAERARAAAGPDTISTEERADLDFTLARALWRAEAERARARALALGCREVYAASPSSSRQLAAVERWLAEHPLR